MEKFGIIKSKILSKLTESYSAGDKNTIKDIISLVKENKDFKELYLLYEDIENKYFSDKETAQFYVNELSQSLKGRFKNVKSICEKIDKMIGDVETKYQGLYDNLDCLIQEDNLLNIETKVRAKIDLVNYLMAEKSGDRISENFTKNETLLYSVLVDNFNDSFSQNLNEEDKKELMGILSMTNEEVENKTKEIKESIFRKIDDLTSVSSDVDLKEKLTKVKSEVTFKDASKYNFFKLRELEREL